jgi:hypothetical protein
MGYTHYWQWKSPLAKTETDGEKFAQWSRDVSTLLEHYPTLQPHWAFLGRFPLPQTWDITIRGPLGEGEPIFTDEQVAFNGDEETGNAHEPFIIELSELSQGKFCASCKIGHCPYDLLVIAALVRFAHYFPTVVLCSDGEQSGLDAGAKLCSKVFGVGVNPLRDPAYYKYVDSTIASWEDG